MLRQRIARREIRELATRMHQVADLMAIQELKASRVYRGLKYRAEDGTVIEVHTWEQYCVLVEGRSVDSVDLDLANLRAFGTELYAALTQQGLGPATLRKWRAIPDDIHAALRAVAAAGDRVQLADLADELLARAGQLEAACGETPQSRAGI